MRTGMFATPAASTAIAPMVACIPAKHIDTQNLAHTKPKSRHVNLASGYASEPMMDGRTANATVMPARLTARISELGYRLSITNSGTISEPARKPHSLKRMSGVDGGKKNRRLIGQLYGFLYVCPSRALFLLAACRHTDGLSDT